ncbi:hypothetical protein [Sphingomicrobium clamense]|nr:hypothetical protein [Sphingomicrobium sp. B8]
MTQPTDEQIRAVQKARSRWTALLLIGFVILVFGITIAKMAVAG